VVVTTKSDKGGNGRKHYFVLACQRCGQYREYAKNKREANISLKDGCPFKLKSYLLISGCWILNVVNSEHDHDMNQNFLGHKYFERLRPDEKELV
jgi:hypothetical protein